MFAADAGQLQTPQPARTREGRREGLDRDERTGFRCVCKCLRQRASCATSQAWHSSFYADPATREASTWLRATATSRERHVGAPSVIWAASKTAPTRSPRHLATGRRQWSDRKRSYARQGANAGG